MGTWESIFKQKGKVFSEPHEDMEEIISIFREAGKKRVLDLGCGSGRHTVLLSKEGFEVVASDVSRSGLEMTRKWLSEEGLEATVKEHSCYERFPFEDDSFDAVISTQVIHHNFHDKVRSCISEIERVLKPQGMVFITVSAEGDNKKRASRSEKVAPQTYAPLDGDEKGLPHFIYTEQQLRDDFKDFRVMKLYKDEGNHWCLLGVLEKIGL